jgi:hypothetical protein
MGFAAAGSRQRARTGDDAAGRLDPLDVLLVAPSPSELDRGEHEHEHEHEHEYGFPSASSAPLREI